MIAFNHAFYRQGDIFRKVADISTHSEVLDINKGYRCALWSPLNEYGHFDLNLFARMDFIKINMLDIAAYRVPLDLAGYCKPGFFAEFDFNQGICTAHCQCCFLLRKLNKHRLPAAFIN